MGTANDRFDDLLRASWGPALREMGFTGSGRVWIIPDQRDWAMLGFQGSQFSSGESLKFTINLLVVGKDAWAEARSRNSFYGAKPSPNILGQHRYSQRAGHLTHGKDHWWTLAGDGSNEAAIDSEVLVAIRTTLAPKLRAEMLDQSPGPRGLFEGVSTT